jgi:hypothetical protein
MAIAFVKDAVANSNGSTTTLAVTIAPAAGNTLVVQSGVAGVQTITGIVDNTGSNTYIVRAGVTNTVRAEVWTATNIVAGVTTVTITYSATSTGNAAVVSEYSGVSAVGANGTNTGAASTPETITLAIGPNGYVVAALANNLGSTESLTIATGTLRDHTASGAGAATVQTAAVDNTAINAVSVVTSVTLGAGVNWAAAAVELQPSSTNNKVPQLLGAKQAVSTSVSPVPGQGFGQGPLVVVSNIPITTWRTAGIFTGLYTRLLTNTGVGTTTLVFQKNGVTGAQTVSIPNTTTGEFQDTSNYDQVASGDTVNYAWATTTTTVSALVSVNFASLNAAQTVENLTCYNTAAGINIQANNVTRFFTIDGAVVTGAVAEATSQFKIKTPGTLQNLQINIKVNSRTTTTTFGTRNAGVNGNLVLSILAGTTGLFEDNVHTDSIVSGSFVNYYITFGAEATAFTVNYFGVFFVTVNGSYYFLNGVLQGFVVLQSVTTNLPLSGNGMVSTTESDFQFSKQVSTLSNLAARVTVSSITVSSTVKLRKNAGNGNQVVSIPGSTIGYFEDLVNTDSVVATDEVNYQIIVGGTGTSMVFNSIGVLAAQAGSASPGFPGLPPGTHLLPITGVGA